MEDDRLGGTYVSVDHLLMALARVLRCVGTLPLDEYRKHVEKVDLPARGGA